MRQIVLLLCGALLFGMCARREHVRTVAVRGVPLGLHERMGNLTKVGACGDYLICANETESTLLTAVAADGTSCVDFGTAGRAGANLLGAWTLTGEDTLCYVYDLNSRKCLSFPVGTLADSVRLSTLFTLSEEAMGIVELIPLDEERFVGIGICPQGRLSVIDRRGRVVASGGNYPDNPQGHPQIVHTIASQGSLCRHPDRSKVAVGTRYGRTLQIFDVEDSVRLAASFEPERIEYDLSADGQFAPNPKTRWGYQSMAADGACIYALYSGKVQFEESAPYRGRSVHVFDWEGRLLYEMALDEEVSAIALLDGALYGIVSGEEGFDLMRFDLP